MSRAIEDFRGLKEFKEEIFEGGFASYYVGHEDGRDAVEKLYLNLDLSSIVPPGSKDGAVEKEAAPTQGETLIELEVIQVTDSTPEQRDRDGDKP